MSEKFFIMIREKIRGMLRKCGLDIVAFNHTTHPFARRMFLLKTHNINVVFDVGANTGQYASKLRELGYAERIVSFEPLSTAYSELLKRASRDSIWYAENIALGNRDGSELINISENSQSSSMLEMLPSHLNLAPDCRYIGTETVTVRKLDSIINNYLKPSDRLYLKVDAQGYEKSIIEGAKKSFDRIIGIQVEASLVELYKGETLLTEMIEFMSDNNYILMSLEPGIVDPRSGQLLQVDCVFFRAQ